MNKSTLCSTRLIFTRKRAYNTRMKRRAGFTIVELVIVILIIGILATIVLVNYNAAQGKARDTRRMSNLSSIAEAITSYRLKYGDPVSTSCSAGYNNTGSGWFNASSGTGYTATILSCLTAKGYLDGSIMDPTNCADTSGTPVSGATCGPKGYAYAKSTCTGSDGQPLTIVMARLEQSGSTANLQGANALCDSATWATNYGLNYMVRVD